MSKKTANNFPEKIREALGEITEDSIKIDEALKIAKELVKAVKNLTEVINERFCSIELLLEGIKEEFSQDI